MTSHLYAFFARFSHILDTRLFALVYIFPMLTSPLFASSPQSAPPIPYLPGIMIDGDIKDWDTAGLRLPFLTPDAPVIPDPAHSHVMARFAWNDTGLLVAIEVTDTTPSEAPSAAGAYLADSVELFLAPDAAKSECLQLVLSPGHDPAHTAPRSYIYDNRPESLQALPQTVEWAIKPRSNGYVAEACLPWASLGIKPAIGVTIATRLFVNDDNGKGVRTRFTWQPTAETGRFHSLTLGGADASSVQETPVAWTSLDVATGTGAINLVGTPSMAGTKWTVQQDSVALGAITLTASGPIASGSLILPTGRATGTLTLTGPNAEVVTAQDTLAANAAASVVTANTGWRVNAVDKTALAFARAEFPEYVFTGSKFPVLNFLDPDRVARLLGAAPKITTRWLDAQGGDVSAPEKTGLYAARSEITLKGRTKPLVLEHIFYHLPDRATVPPIANETAAQLLAFGLQGANATPGQASRATERWWHTIRRARGWSQALDYKLHVPEGDGTRPRPLIVHLHGTGQNTDKSANDLLAVLAKIAGSEPLIVYPKSSARWCGPAVAEVIDEVMNNHDIDPERIYLIGFSMGGIGSWEVALDMPERFAAVVPIGGRMGSPADAPRLKDTPLWVFNGADDPTTTPDEATIMVEAVRTAGGNPRLTLLEGKSHGESQASAYTYPGLFDWMLSQRRGGHR